MSCSWHCRSTVANCSSKCIVVHLLAFILGASRQHQGLLGSQRSMMQCASEAAHREHAHGTQTGTKARLCAVCGAGVNYCPEVQVSAHAGQRGVDAGGLVLHNHDQAQGRLWSSILFCERTSRCTRKALVGVLLRLIPRRKESLRRYALPHAPQVTTPGSQSMSISVGLSTRAPGHQVAWPAQAPRSPPGAVLHPTPVPPPRARCRHHEACHVGHPVSLCPMHCACGMGARIIGYHLEGAMTRRRASRMEVSPMDASWDALVNTSAAGRSKKGCGSSAPSSIKRTTGIPFCAAWSATNLPGVPAQCKRTSAHVLPSIKDRAEAGAGLCKAGCTLRQGSIKKGILRCAELLGEEPLCRVLGKGGYQVA